MPVIHHAPIQDIVDARDLAAHVGIEALVLWLGTHEPIIIDIDGVTYTIRVERTPTGDG